MADWLTNWLVTEWVASCLITYQESDWLTNYQVTEWGRYWLTGSRMTSRNWRINIWRFIYVSKTMNTPASLKHEHVSLNVNLRMRGLQTGKRTLDYTQQWNYYTSGISWESRVEQQLRITLPHVFCHKWRKYPWNNWRIINRARAIQSTATTKEKPRFVF